MKAVFSLHCTYYRRDKGSYPWFAAIKGGGTIATGTFSTIPSLKGWARAIAKGYHATIKFEKV